MVLEGGWASDGQIVVLQPRRLSARLLAGRVAWERQGRVGDEVGYQIRFENRVSSRTRIRFVTEGILLRQMVEDPSLRGVSVLIFDEFHERHLYEDITLAQALKLRRETRPDLRIVVMSATLDIERLEAYLSPCAVVHSEGRTFPVEIEYAATPAYADSRPVWDQAADALEDYVQSGGEGDALIFMPGGFEITQTLEALRRRPSTRGFALLPLHGELPPADQDAAIARYDRRKAVVATNVAETSLTIDGIRCVIDSGLARIPRFDPHRGINTLLIEKISRAAAEQRAGRAGRTAPGVCFRLWSREEHSHRPAHELPEVKRLDLAEVVLMLKAAGVTDLRTFRWLEPPEERALAGAEALLLDLGAIRAVPERASETAITETGRKMLAFPLHPRYSRMLLAAGEFGCVEEACLIAALTQGRDLLARKTDPRTLEARLDLMGAHPSSDFELLQAVWERVAESQFAPGTCQRLGVVEAAARQVAPLRNQFLDIAGHVRRADRLDSALTEKKPVFSEALRKCILTGFSDRVARKPDPESPRCELLHGRRGALARESAVQNSPLLVAAEVREVEGRDKNVETVLSLATAIEPQWLEELFPEDIASTLRVYFDTPTRRVCAEDQRCFRGLPIGVRRVEPPPADPAASLFAAEVLAGRLEMDEWDESVEQWILRLNLLCRWCPDLNLTPITDDDRRQLVEQMCHGCFGAKDVKALPAKTEVRNWLNPQAQLLVDKHAPERLKLPNGKTTKITYHPDNPPYIAARIQELYDMPATPRIAMNRVTVLLHILAPSYRPVQITQDLPGFWRDHYPRIKQELMRKYPKHQWR